MTDQRVECQWRQEGEYKVCINAGCGNRVLSTKPLRARCKGSPGKAAGPTPDGPGSELESLLSTMGYRASASCACKKLRDDMNTWGPDGCREKLGEILERLERNAKTLGTRVYNRRAARVVVKLAIYKAARRERREKSGGD